LDHQAAVGRLLELAHQVLDALREAAQLHRHALALRDVELELHRRGEVAQYLLGPVRQRVEAALGEVQARRGAADQIVERDEDQPQGHEADRRVDQVLVLFHPALHHPDRCPRITTPVANSAKPITDRKKSRSRASITPRWKPSKCVTTENEATVSTSAGLAQRVIRSVTGLKPARIRNRQITTERMNATTWLRVIAEVMHVTAR